MTTGTTNVRSLAGAVSGAVAGLGMAMLLTCTASGALAADPGKGKELYETHCERCHGEDGRGQAAGAPDFTRGAALLVPDTELVRMLRGGRGAMPAFEGLLRQDDFLDVIAYLRSFQP